MITQSSNGSKELLDRHLTGFRYHTPRFWVFAITSEIEIILFMHWKDNENSPIIKFLISSSVSNFWNHKTSNDLIISSISGVCHLSSTDISLLDTRFHHLANYSDYLKCDEITDGLAKYIPYDIAHGLITWFDVNDDAKIDFKGMILNVLVWTSKYIIF